jgi:hypothetical protein
MIELKGYKCEFPFQGLFKVGDLVNYQGPLLSLFSNKKGELYLYDWSDSDNKYNRWLIFRISLEQLIQYLNKNLSHYQIIKTYYTDCIYSVDLDNDLNYNNIVRLNVDEIPEEYLPDKDVLHDDEECPHLEIIKSYINELELKTDEIRKKKWQDKFKISIPIDQMMIGCRKTYNSGQLLMPV